MNHVLELSQKAKRIAAIGQILDTFEDRNERMGIIRALVDGLIISDAAGDLLIDEYAPGLAG